MSRKTAGAFPRLAMVAATIPGLDGFGAVPAEHNPN